jgi:hypothetical protein
MYLSLGWIVGLSLGMALIVYSAYCLGKFRGVRKFSRTYFDIIRIDREGEDSLTLWTRNHHATVRPVTGYDIGTRQFQAERNTLNLLDVIRSVTPRSVTTQS